jgi:hypothetical protein
MGSGPVSSGCHPTSPGRSMCFRQGLPYVAPHSSVRIINSVAASVSGTDTVGVVIAVA